jgi:hypothetical protein
LAIDLVLERREAPIHSSLEADNRRANAVDHVGMLPDPALEKGHPALRRIT